MNEFSQVRLFLRRLKAAHEGAFRFYIDKQRRIRTIDGCCPLEAITIKMPHNINAAIYLAKDLGLDKRLRQAIVGIADNCLEHPLEERTKKLRKLIFKTLNFPLI